MLARDFIRRIELSGGQRLTNLRRFYNELLRGGLREYVPNANGATALVRAAMQGDTEVVGKPS